MAQNLVIPDKDNRVVFIFGGVDLTASTNIILDLDGESYSSTGGTPKLTVISATELSCDLSGTTKVGKIFATVTYFDGGSVNGTDISSRVLGNSDEIVIAIGSQLIIEDGSIVDNANSITTDLEFISYARGRGIKIPSTEPDRDALQIQANDYLFGVESKLSGCRVSSTQSLPFPRVGSTVHGFSVESTLVHINAKKASMELALQINSTGLYAVSSSQNVKKEKLGSMETEYFEGGSSGIIATGRADVYLNSLYENNGSMNEMGRV